MTDPAALTDEELAQITAKAEGSMVSSSGWAREYSVDVPRLIASLRASRAEVERMETIAARSRFVAEHWRRSIMLGNAVWAAHPLCMVLSAMDGESDPAQCGLTVEAAEAFRSLG